jgi:hypothetical protein
MNINMKKTIKKYSTFYNAKKIIVTNAKCVLKSIHFYQDVRTDKTVCAIAKYFVEKE